VTPGAIVLLHDGYGDRAATVTALATILPTLVDRRLHFVTP
jgi:peptidoglycan/xylan/chitin deacetylase (PgdA/CDA1 family)